MHEKNLLAVNGLNATETPPPKYNSCANNTQLNTSAMHLDEGQSSQNARMQSRTNPFNNVEVETEESFSENSLKNVGKETVEDTTVEGRSSKNVAGEPKVSLGFESEGNLFRKNSGDEPNENSGQNADQVFEDHAKKYVEVEPKENFGSVNDESRNGSEGKSLVAD